MSSFGFHRGDRYGQSSHAAGYVPGIEWQDGDEDLIEPTTGWGGNRGAKLKGGESFGRLYRQEGDWTEAPDEADPDVVVARSAQRSGFRGARPFFGAEDRMRLKAGQMEYDGPQAGGIVLGLAAIYVVFKLLESGRG